MKKTFQILLMAAITAAAISCAGKPDPVSAPEPDVQESQEQSVVEDPKPEMDPESSVSGPRQPVDEADLAPDQTALEALAAAKAGADAAREQARAAGGDAACPDDWSGAEETYGEAESLPHDTRRQAREASARYKAAGDKYKAIYTAVLRSRADESRALADGARQEALGVKANVAARSDYNTADALYNRSASSYKAGSFAEAAEGYARSTELFIAARDAAIEKRAAADAAIKAAAEKAEESDDLARDSVRILGGGQE
ncbi:MAG: hypothetical protein LBB48_03570 [Treponema sp.]|jgi:hypothetical protein|nr:hypothetical protein [Treponema sp.]